MKFTLKYPIVPATINQKFGEGKDYYKKNLGLDGHPGWDFQAKDGQPVYASHDGIVTFVGYDGAGGLGVVIRTKDKYEYGAGDVYFKTVYWHLKTGSVVVKVDQDIKCGDLIGGADNTGLSTGTHLHFSIKPVYQGEQSWQWSNIEQNNGFAGAIDPAPYWTGEYAYTDNKFPVNIKYGQRSEEVKKLQNFLKNCGFFPKGQTSTGYYGDITADAVLQFQLYYKVDNPQVLLDNKGHYFYNKSRNVANSL